jgi:multidrug resistance efflux pump
MIAGLVDRDLSPAVQEEVGATLEAATADPELAAAVCSGRLVKPLRYAGFGNLPDLADAMATRSSEPAKNSGAAAPSPDLTEARDRVLELSGLADDAQRRYETAVKNATEARQILETAEAERAEAHKAAKAAHADAEKARRALGRLERR